MKKKGSLERLIPPEEQKRLLEKIAGIEKRSCGEVRIHVTERRVKDPLEAARRTFAALGMSATKRRNGVLVFLSLASRRFAIVGDEGIDRVSPAEYWESLKNKLARRFAGGEYCQGLLEILDSVEGVLVRHFPYEKGDVDELPDDISYQPRRSRALPGLIAGGVLLTAALLFGVWRLFFRGWS